MLNRNDEHIYVIPMHIEDVEAVYAIERNTFSTPWTEDAFVNEIKLNHLARYWVIKLNDVIIGYGGCWFIVDEAHITNIAIDGTYRGRGFGKYLVQCMINDVKDQGINAATLEVRSSNDIAINMYQSVGFKIEGVRKNYYDSPNEDALILWKVF